MCQQMEKHSKETSEGFQRLQQSLEVMVGKIALHDARLGEHDVKIKAM